MPLGKCKDRSLKGGERYGVRCVAQRHDAFIPPSMMNHCDRLLSILFSERLDLVTNGLSDEVLAIIESLGLSVATHFVDVLEQSVG